MLSGFFGLIAIETSAGLIALDSVMRTTCCAFDVMEMMGSRKSILVHGFIDSFYRILLHLAHSRALRSLATDWTDDTDLSVFIRVIRGSLLSEKARVFAFQSGDQAAPLEASLRDAAEVSTLVTFQTIQHLVRFACRDGFLCGDGQRFQSFGLRS